MRVLPVALLLVSCAEPTDRRDGTGDQRVAGDVGPAWSWCPDSSAYVGGAWSYEATVTEDALLCIISNGATLPEALANRTQVRLVAGTYPLPDAAGSYTMTLPVCLLRPGMSSGHGGDGALTVTINSYTSWDESVFSLTQPMTFGSGSWTLDLELRVRSTTGASRPSLVLDDQLIHDDLPGTIAHYTLEGPGWAYPWPIYPCQTYDSAGRQQGATFDRGNLNVQDAFIPGVFGAGGTAAQLTRAWGELDGVAFDQEDFFRLAHLTDHHNSGGGFLVRFDAPINEACGLEVHIPSHDGGWANLEGWALDCDLGRLGGLTGLARQ